MYRGIRKDFRNPRNFSAAKSKNGPATQSSPGRRNFFCGKIRNTGLQFLERNLDLIVVLLDLDRHFGIGQFEYFVRFGFLGSSYVSSISGRNRGDPLVPLGLVTRPGWAEW